ncbi:MAG: hypothetical protein QOG54_2845 [Actinomycetota bacterium]|jgi:hypothetical protein|nr:hypothetical protein [Actinomycetota bacterium]
MGAAPSELVAAIDERWDRLWPLLDALENDPDAKGTWTVKDVYAHLGRWDLVTGLAISARVDGRSTADWDVYFSGYTRSNARWSRQDIDLSMEEARFRCKSAHGRLALALRSLNNEDWDDYIVGLATDVRNHYQAHLEAPLEFATS